MKTKTDPAGTNRSGFHDFAPLFDRLIASIKADRMSIAEATAATGFKLAKDQTHSDNLLLLYDSSRYDGLAPYDRSPELARLPRTPGGNPFLEGIELRMPGPGSNSKGMSMDLQLKEGTRFTLADFDAHFKQARRMPGEIPHPSPMLEPYSDHVYSVDQVKVTVTCEKKTGVCRTIYINHFRPQPPAAEKR